MGWKRGEIPPVGLRFFHSRWWTDGGVLRSHVEVTSVDTKHGLVWLKFLGDTGGTAIPLDQFDGGVGEITRDPLAPYPDEPQRLDRESEKTLRALDALMEGRMHIRIRLLLGHVSATPSHGRGAREDRMELSGWFRNQEGHPEVDLGSVQLFPVTPEGAAELVNAVQEFL